jgi:hypothetical protein
LKSVDRAAEAALIKLIGVSRQEHLVDPRIDSTVSYQRNRQTMRSEPRLVTIVDGALINSSSTFGTLLSSQGSCAHHRRTSRSGFGATRLTYRSVEGPSNRHLAPVSPHLTAQNTAAQGLRSSVLTQVSSIGPAARARLPPRPCVPSLPARQDRTLRSAPSGVKSVPCGSARLGIVPGQSIVSARPPVSGGASAVPSKPNGTTSM